jgi:hypothetical protein
MGIENSQVNIPPNTEETLKIGRLPLELRNPFQIEVFKLLNLNENTEIEKIIKYSKIISNLIDDHSQTNIRDLIVKKEFVEAAKSAVNLIQTEQKEETAQAA